MAGDETAASRDSAERQMIAGWFGVTQLPDSVRDIQCRAERDPCDMGNEYHSCYVRIEPADFDALSKQARFRRNAGLCPGMFSSTYQMGLVIGPDYKIHEEHHVDAGELQVGIYPDAAHSQFVATMSRETSNLRCDHW